MIFLIFVFIPYHSWILLIFILEALYMWYIDVPPLNISATLLIFYFIMFSYTCNCELIEIIRRFKILE